MARPTLWAHWTWRDLRARWTQVLAIAAIVAIGTALYSGLTSTSQWRRDSYDASYAALDVHDVRVELTAGTWAPRGRLTEFVGALAADLALVGSSERLSFPTPVDASIDGKTILVSGRIIGIDTSAGEPPIDKVGILRGRNLDAGDIGQPTAVIDVHFAQHYGLPSDGQVKVGANTPLRYVGHGEGPGQFLSLTDSGSLFAEATFVVLYTSLPTAQALGALGDVTNEIVVDLAEGADRRAAARAIEDFAATHGGLAVKATALDDDRVYSYLYADIDSDQRFFNIFAFLVLAGAAFASFNLTGRMVEAQRREIGIGMALGARGAMLAIRPALVAAQIIAGGVVLGMLGGLGINALMRDLLAQFLPLPIWRTPLQVGAFARGAALGALLPMAATAWPVARAVRVAPIDALRTTQYARPGGLLAPVLRHVRLPGSSLGQMPVREVLRAPRRTLLTTLGVAAAIATLVAVIGMVDTFLSTIDRGEREILAGHPARMTVDLAGFQPADGAAARAVTGARTIETAVPGLQLAGLLHSAREPEGFGVYVTLFDWTNPLWVPTAIEGTLDATRPGIVISQKAADDLGAQVGQSISLRHPLRRGDGFSLATTELDVVAVHPNPYRFVAFMDIRYASLMNLAGAINMFQVVPREGVSSTEVQRELFGTPSIAAAQPVAEVVNAIRDFIGEILDILLVARGAVLLLAVLIAFNSTSIAADERRRQHATMFAFGLPLPRVVRMAVIENAIIGILGTALGIALGYGILEWIVRALIPDTMPDLGVDTYVDRVTVMTAALLGILAVSAAPLFTVRRLRRMAIPETLRVQE